MTTLFELAAVLRLDTKEYEKGISDSKKSASGFGDVLKGTLASAAIQKGISTLTSGIKTAAGAFKNITIAATQSYASYEQLTGGVETLFGKSSKQVMKYAENAYKSAGMSSNEYMSTVTSFSASLLSSLGGDTKKAADYADRAVRDMSDNANKMGTDIGSIQTAYQGFAKQNYTMLDNLKLGYGGTKEEAARLVSEASKMTGVMKELGVEVKEDDLSFGNLVNAISVVQKNMGITGTTTKEAMTTIEGSANATKAAWQNVLSAIAGGGDLKTAMKQLQDSIFGEKNGEGLLNQIIPRVKQVFQGIADFVAQAAPIIQEKLPKLLDDLKPVLQNLMKSISDILRTLIPLLVPVFIEIGGALVTGIIQGLHDLGPVGEFIMHAMQFLVAAKFVTGAASLVKAIGSVATALVSLAKTGISTVQTGLSGLISFITAHPMVAIIAAVVAAIVAAVVLIVKNWDKIKKAAKDLFKNISETFGQIKTGITNAVKGMVEGVSKWWNDMGQKIGSKASEIKTGVQTKFSEIKMNVSEAMRNLKENVGNTFTNLKSAISETAGNIATTAREKFTQLKTSTSELWGQISEAMRNPIGTAKSFIEQAINAVKGVFDGLASFARGIASAMKQVGEAIVAPIKAAYETIKTIMNGVKGVFNTIKTTATNIGNTVKNVVSNTNKAKTTATTAKAITLPTPKATKHADALNEGIIFNRLTTFGYDSAGRAHQAGEAGSEALIGTKSLSNIIKNAVRNGMSGTANGVVVNVYGNANQDVNDLADAVADRLQTLVDRKAAVWA